MKKKIGEKYLIPLLGVWDSFDEIDFDTLPDQFVLKCNHGSGWNAIVRDKASMDRVVLKEKFDKWMGMNYAYYQGLELQYEKIRPRILAEKYLEPPTGGDIEDYKFFVFDGKVRLIEVDMDRTKGHKRNLYTPDWTYLPYTICYPTDPKKRNKKPNSLRDMIGIAETLGSEFVHVRVDLYYWNNLVYFGEMTFCHDAGIGKIDPEHFDLTMGDWISL